MLQIRILVCPSVFVGQPGTWDTGRDRPGTLGGRVDRAISAGRALFWGYRALSWRCRVLFWRRRGWFWELRVLFRRRRPFPFARRRRGWARRAGGRFR